MTAARVRLGFIGSLVCLLAIAGLALHSADERPNKPAESWKNGYWIWAGGRPAEASFRSELLYVEAPGQRWPKNLPEADEYVAVHRIESGARLTREVAHSVANNYKGLIADAGASRVRGLQIDYDSPAGKLESYAQFLRWIREALPPGSRLSITALLDWFREDTSITRLLHEVDEFVPQFYDTAPQRHSAGIAEPVDAKKWAEVFNSHGVPYRIGISTFGRVARMREGSVRYFRDATPLDFAGQPEFRRSVRGNASGELVVRYDVLSSIGKKLELQTGDAVEITFPTEASIRAAYTAAREFGGYCAGVLFFRWPAESETVTFAPGDVQRIVTGAPPAGDATIETRDAVCLERRCQDVYLDQGSAIQSEDRVVQLRTDIRVELFLPEGPLHSFLTRSGHIAVHVPAYSGFGKIYLGRAFSEGSHR